MEDRGFNTDLDMAVDMLMEDVINFDADLVIETTLEPVVERFFDADFSMLAAIDEAALND